MFFNISELYVSFGFLPNIRRNRTAFTMKTRIVRSTSENEGKIFHSRIAAPGDAMLLCNGTPHHNERESPIRLRDHSATPTPVTANNVSHFYFKFLDFVVETISSAIESINLSFRTISGPISTTFTLHPVDHDRDRDHRGFGRNNLVDYFRFDTDLYHFIAHESRSAAKWVGGARPPAMAAGPLVASRLAFPIGRDQRPRPCDAPRKGVAAPSGASAEEVCVP